HGPRRGVQDGDVAGSLTVAGQAEESICDVQGLDTRVRADRVDVVPAGGRTVEGFADYALKHGLATRSRVLESDTRPATVTEAETLHIGPGAALFEMRRLRFLDGLVVVLEHNRVPLALCPALAETDFTATSLYLQPGRAAARTDGGDLPGGPLPLPGLHHRPTVRM
ncbi:MAG: transcriptional regulator, GntR family with sensor domain, partial [Streptosporangiaceae bacterium]|nr:transcriptional regulator, GntR family with sensor domain [Streptosporangiaceae bacterium]